MGKITLYSDMLLSEYHSTSFLRERTEFCLSKDTLLFMNSVDWWLWWYILLELSIKRYCISIKLNRNANSHNISSLVNTVLQDFKDNMFYDVKLEEYLQKELGLTTRFLESSYVDLLKIDFVLLRYSYSYGEFVRTRFSTKQASQLLDVFVAYLEFTGV